MQQIETPKQAEEFIKVQGINIEYGQAYSLFTCGCVSREMPYYIWVRYKNKEVKIHNKEGFNLRCCRDHKKRGLYIGTFKKCKCGALTFAQKNVHSGGVCPVCQTHIRATRPIRNKLLSKKRNIKEREENTSVC